MTVRLQFVHYVIKELIKKAFAYFNANAFHGLQAYGI